MIIFQNKTFKVYKCWIKTDQCGGGRYEFFVDLHNGKNVRVFKTSDKAISWACHARQTSNQ